MTRSITKFWISAEKAATSTLAELLETSNSSNDWDCAMKVLTESQEVST